MLQKKIRIKTLYLDITSQAYARWMSNTQESAFLEPIAKAPQAIWLTSTAAIQYLGHKLAAAAAANEIAVLVLYNIPKRDDSGQYSSGGARSEQEYRDYIKRICDFIDDKQVMVIVEPDAVPDMLNDDFDANDKAWRTRLIIHAIDELSRLQNTDVYLDCGHSDWPDEAKLMTWLDGERILDRVTGLALNVSNFRSTEACLQRARRIIFRTDASQELPVIVDCSRNGAVVDLTGKDAWCNPLGARLGDEPSLTVDGFHGQLWIKRPGESDGDRNSKTSAGGFDLELAKRLLGMS
ncbi:glycoside hydrolase family 6 protein [Cupriavidus sp. 30B13]|uniref:glycoside hydrolase family 6 protein n=1 Tax=Cupriavidus sp. 30B13 TaxID=3384241 RepID=UPI003B9056EE